MLVATALCASWMVCDLLSIAVPNLHPFAPTSVRYAVAKQGNCAALGKTWQPLETSQEADKASQQ